MKKLVLILLICFITSNIYSQSGWFWLNPLPQGNDLNSVVSIGPNLIFAAGIGGTIIKSSDGGLNWEIQKSNIINNLYDIYFTNINSGYTCGSNGNILRTTDSGSNWILSNYGSDQVFSSIFFVNNSTGYACGKNLFFTTNAGVNWQQKDSISLYKIFFIDSYNAYGLSHGKIYKTTNAGYNWLLLENDGFLTFNCLYFNNISTGFFGGQTFIYPSSYSNNLYKTTNGFINSSSCLNSNIYTLTSVQFLDSLGFCTGYNYQSRGMIYKTVNSGNNWDSLIYPTKMGLNSISKTYNENIYTVGEGGIILKTSNIGNDWHDVYNNFYTDLSSIKFCNNFTGYAVGTSSLILKTTNSGSNWNQIGIGQINSSINSIELIGDSIIYITGNNGKIYKSINSGTNWLLLNNNLNYSLIDSYFFNKDKGFVVGWTPNSSVVLKTIDGGQNWIPSINPTNQTYKCITFVDSNTGYIGASYNLKLKTTDCGISWFNLPAASSYIHCQDIKFINTQTGYITGDDGKIIKTTDEGISWEFIPSGSTSYLLSIDFANENTGFIAGWNGTILYTSNGGLNWTPQISPTQNSFYSVCAVSPNMAYIAGIKGAILKTTNGGIPLEVGSNLSEYPKQFSLFQNYPNPFNPSTNIKYQIVNSKVVTLKIYDILGRELSTLVNEKQNAGTYEITWNATDYPSGIYFYTLTTDEYTETKKMVLIK